MSDLISRRALKKYMRDYKWEFALNSDFSKAIEMVDVQPAIEAVPVVHGKWIRNENPIEISCECSVCHAKDYWYDIDKANEYYWFNRKFCPNCGAKMDGGSDQ